MRLTSLVWKIGAGALLALAGCEAHVHTDGPPARVEVEPRRPPADVHVDVKPANPDRPAAKVDVNVQRR